MLDPVSRLFSSLWNYLSASIEGHYKKLGEKAREELDTREQDQSKRKIIKK